MAHDENSPLQQSSMANRSLAPEIHPGQCSAPDKTMSCYLGNRSGINGMFSQNTMREVGGGWGGVACISHCQGGFKCIWAKLISWSWISKGDPLWRLYTVLCILQTQVNYVVDIVISRMRNMCCCAPLAPRGFSIMVQIYLSAHSSLRIWNIYFSAKQVKSRLKYKVEWLQTLLTWCPCERWIPTAIFQFR